MRWHEHSGEVASKEALRLSLLGPQPAGFQCQKVVYFGFQDVLVLGFVAALNIYYCWHYLHYYSTYLDHCEWNMHLPAHRVFARIAMPLQLCTACTACMALLLVCISRLCIRKETAAHHLTCCLTLACPVLPHAVEELGIVLPQSKALIMVEKYVAAIYNCHRCWHTAGMIDWLTQSAFAHIQGGSDFWHYDVAQHMAPVLANSSVKFPAKLDWPDIRTHDSLP